MINPKLLAAIKALAKESEKAKQRVEIAKEILPKKDLSESVAVVKLIENLARIQKGDKGDTPKKGVDYYTPAEAKSFLEAATPVKGVDYFDGDDGDTPKKGTDYFTEQEVKQFKKDVTPVKGKDYKDGDDGDDAIANMDEVEDVVIDAVKKSEKDHLKKFDHKLIHDPFLLGTKKVKEAGMKKDMFLQYNGEELVYATIKNIATQLGPYGLRHGYMLPSQEGNTGKVLTSGGSSGTETWETASAGGAVATDTIWDAKGDVAVGTGANTAARLPVGANGLVLTADSAETTGMKWGAVAGTGDFVGPASSTDNAIVRFDGTTGKAGQNSAVTIADTTGNIAGPEEYKLRGTTSGTTAIVATAVAGTTTLTLPAATDTLVGKATTDTLTNKTIDADGTGNSITNIENADIKAAAAIALNKLAALTASEVVVTDASGFLTNVAGVSSTEVGYLNGVTSAIQTQLDAKQASDAELTALAGLTSAADKGIQFTGSGTASTYDLTTAGKALLDDADAAAQRTTLGVGAIGQLATIVASVGCVIGDGTNVITTGQSATIIMPFGMTITGWTIVECSDTATSSSIVVDVWKDTYANYPPTVADTIAGTEKPTLSTATKGQDLTLSSWTTSVTAGDIIKFNVDSVTSAKRIAITIIGTRTT